MLVSRFLVDPLQTEQPGGGIADATDSRSIYTDQDGEDMTSSVHHWSTLHASPAK